MASRPLWWKQRARSVMHAGRGLRLLLASQTHARIHLLASVLVALAGVSSGISRYDWLWLIVAIAMVWLAEALNTALEFLADAAVPQWHPLVRNAKDIAAGAVLLASASALIIGGMVFLPYWS